MRPGWLISVGISLLGCKDNHPTPPSAPATPPPAPVAAEKPAPTPGPAPSHVAPVTAPATDRPRLDEAFAAEEEDKAWASATEQAIQAVAPELTKIECHQTQCQAVVTAASTEALAQLTTKLEGPDALPSTDAKNVLLTAPVTEDGKTSMTIYIRYER